MAAAWAWPGPSTASPPPSTTCGRCWSCGCADLLALANETAWWHPIHLHGHSFRVLTRNGAATRFREWLDTVLIPPRERVEIGFVADNPGAWMIHCHVLDHQNGGMMATIDVT